MRQGNPNLVFLHIQMTDVWCKKDLKCLPFYVKLTNYNFRHGLNSATRLASPHYRSTVKRSQLNIVFLSTMISKGTVFKLILASVTFILTFLFNFNIKICLISSFINVQSKFYWPLVCVRARTRAGAPIFVQIGRCG